MSEISNKGGVSGSGSDKVSRKVDNKTTDQNCLFCLEPCPSVIYVSPLCNCPCSYHNTCKKKWDKTYPNTCPICRNQIIHVINSNTKYNIGTPKHVQHDDIIIPISPVYMYQENPGIVSEQRSSTPISRPPQNIHEAIVETTANNRKRNIVSCLISVAISVGIIVILKVAGGS